MTQAETLDNYREYDPEQYLPPSLFAWQERMRELIAALRTPELGACSGDLYMRRPDGNCAPASTA